jgi:integrase
MRLTRQAIEPLVCPPGKQDVLVFDDELKGFCLRVTSGGAKVYLFQYRHGAAVRRLVLGRFGEIPPGLARKLAEQARGQVAAGRDPVAEKAARLSAEQATRAEAKRATEADAFTLENLVDRWAALGLKDRSASHRREAPAAIKRGLPDLWGQPAHAITTAAAQHRIDAIGEGTPTQAIRVRAYARAAFNWAMARELIEANPFDKVAIDTREVSRDRVLSDDELGRLWNATGRLAYPFGPLLRLLVLTLQRRSEVAGLRWGELGPGLTVWTIPAARAKNGKAHIVHLSAPARAILAPLPRRAGSDLVFTTTGHTPVSGFSRAGTKLRELMDGTAAAGDQAAGAEAGEGAAPAWRLHDFRRTGVTTLARLNVPPHVADRILNHVQGTIKGVAAVYQRHEFMAEREAAMDVWAAHVLAVAKAAAKRGSGHG